MGPKEYELVWWVRWLPLLFVTALVVGPAVLLWFDVADGDAPAWVVVTRVVVIVVGLGVAAWQGLVMAHRVVLDDLGVLLVGRLRTVTIAWDELVGVSHSRWDYGSDQLRWHRRGGWAVITSSRFLDMEEMLDHIARHAPEALAAPPRGRPVRPSSGDSVRA